MFFKFNLFGFLWALIILVLSVLPGKDMPETKLINADKIGHAAVYAVLVFLLIVGFIKQHRYMRIRHNPIRIAITAGIVYGTILEVLQEVFFDERYFSFGDILANTSGCLLGSLVFFLIYFKI